ncbi:uncharacterized protein G2W53_007504 [Senna tora]|uniref:Uncharacterized protein n=1 Tax=Senna tora TaxID=362788 RepID=A0A834X747_9FABA|nr:uncharacterized protein G2W53_007504 [Senna tora]
MMHTKVGVSTWRNEPLSMIAYEGTSLSKALSKMECKTGIKYDMRVRQNREEKEAQNWGKWMGLIIWGRNQVSVDWLKVVQPAATQAG